jgi:hypothetical protein
MHIWMPFVIEFLIFGAFAVVMFFGFVGDCDRIAKRHFAEWEARQRVSGNTDRASTLASGNAHQRRIARRAAARSNKLTNA